MKFYIEYEGQIPSANAKNKEARRSETHLIRRCFHSQLLRLWDDRFGAVAGLPPHGHPSRKEQRRKYLEEQSIPVEGTDFIIRPLINKTENLVCALDITLYRHDRPGSFVGPAGDLDNRIKALFDALTMPNKAQVDGIEPQQGERPLFCLLQDDAMIIDLRIKTVQLWTTFNSIEEKRDLKVAVNVTVMSTEFAGYGVAALPDI